jgi:hypothetical protein
VVIEDVPQGLANAQGVTREVAAFPDETTAEKFLELYRSGVIPGHKGGFTCVVDYKKAGVGSYRFRCFSRKKFDRLWAARQKEAANG